MYIHIKNLYTNADHSFIHHRQNPEIPQMSLSQGTTCGAPTHTAGCDSAVQREEQLLCWKPQQSPKGAKCKKADPKATQAMMPCSGFSGRGQPAGTATRSAAARGPHRGTDQLRGDSGEL